MREDVQRRINKKFASDFFDDIKDMRVKMGTDNLRIHKKPLSDDRITKAMLDLPELKIMKDKIIKMPRKEDLK